MNGQDSLSNSNLIGDKIKLKRKVYLGKSFHLGTGGGKKKEFQDNRFNPFETTTSRHTRRRLQKVNNINDHEDTQHDSTTATIIRKSLCHRMIKNQLIIV